MSPTSAPKLRFYSNPMSRARMVHWMLQECDAEYETITLDYGPPMKSAQYLAINPMGKVPALQHGDTVVTETGAILAYLAELYPEKQLAPAMGSPERGSYLRWLFFVAGPVEAVSTAKTEGWLNGQTPQQAVTAGFGRFDDVVATLLHAVRGKQYVCGTHFTAADLYLASYLGWSMQQGTLPALPEFSAYALPLLARPASARADALDGPLEQLA
ncbi:MAG: glutathione S-transferase family protein [Comamonas sp.]